MSFRPAGYSSDEDDNEFNNFSFQGEIKSAKERQEEIAAEVYNKRLETENTALYRFYTAVIKGDVDQIRDEIKNGFDVNCEISADWTPLFLSATQGNPVVVKELLENGADITLTRDGFTPLMAVCNCPQRSITADDTLTIVRLLLEYSVDVTAKDRKRRTAFMFACSQGYIEVVKLLFSLTDLEVEDNQGWTPLFYAVSENNYEVVKYLIENGANIEHNDVRNNDVKYYAVLEDFDSILNLLPKSDFDISPEDFANNDYDYESVFQSLIESERPDFKPDISSLLYGMKSQNFIPIFNKSSVDLFTFLALEDEDLKELGVLLSFQRKRILHGLFNFHRHSWTKKSIPFVPMHETFTTHDVFVTISNAIKHITILEASLKFLKQNFDFSDTNIKKDIVAAKTIMALRRINRIKITVSLLHAKAIQYDSTCQGPADMITKEMNLKKNLLKKKFVIGLTGVTVLFIFRCIKSRLIDFVKISTL